MRAGKDLNQYATTVNKGDNIDTVASEGPSKEKKSHRGVQSQTQSTALMGFSDLRVVASERVRSLSLSVACHDSVGLNPLVHYVCSVSCYNTLMLLHSLLCCVVVTAPPAPIVFVLQSYCCRDATNKMCIWIINSIQYFAPGSTSLGCCLTPPITVF